MESVDYFEILPYINTNLTLLLENVDMDKYTKIINEVHSRCISKMIKINYERCYADILFRKYGNDVDTILKQVAKNGNIYADDLIFPSFFEIQKITRHMNLKPSEYYESIDMFRNSLKNIKPDDINIDNMIEVSKFYGN